MLFYKHLSDEHKQLEKLHKQSKQNRACINIVRSHQIAYIPGGGYRFYTNIRPTSTWLLRCLPPNNRVYSVSKGLFITRTIGVNGTPVATLVQLQEYTTTQVQLQE